MQPPVNNSFHETTTKPGTLTVRLPAHRQRTPEETTNLLEALACLLLWSYRPLHGKKKSWLHCSWSWHR